MRQLFSTDGIRGPANKYPLVPEEITKISKAIALFFKKKNRNHHMTKIIIGKDTRLSGYMIETAVVSGICSAGVNAYLVGPMPTPAIAHLVRSFAADAGIVISASHNPFYDNGIKVFNANGHKLNDREEEEIESLIDVDPNVEGAGMGKAFRIDDARGRYIEFVKSSINNNSLKKLRVVVDCANGAAYSVTPKIISELGADVIAINNKPNGLNINDNCGALHPEVLAKEVVKQKADVGIALDGDADRVILVDEKGKILDGDEIILMSALYLKEKGRLRNNLVVTTVMSNYGLEKALNENGIKLVRSRVGDKYVAEKMRELNASLGGEQSGHIIFSDYSTTGDGTITALQVLNILKEKNAKLSEYTNLFEKTPQILINVEVKEKKPLESLKEVMSKKAEAEKLLSGKGRLLIRYSGTQSLLRIMVEGTDKELIKRIANELAEIANQEINK